MVETGNGTVTPVVSNLRIDPALVDGYLPFAHFFPSFIRMLYLLHSLVKYIYMPIYPRVLVYQDLRLSSHRLREPGLTAPLPFIEGTYPRSFDWLYRVEALPFSSCCVDRFLHIEVH